jgi:hypothetical protein
LNESKLELHKKYQICALAYIFFLCQFLNFLYPK